MLPERLFTTGMDDGGNNHNPGANAIKTIYNKFAFNNPSLQNNKIPKEKNFDEIPEENNILMKSRDSDTDIKHSSRIKSANNFNKRNLQKGNFKEKKKLSAHSLNQIKDVLPNLDNNDKEEILKSIKNYDKTHDENFKIILEKSSTQKSNLNQKLNNLSYRNIENSEENFKSKKICSSTQTQWRTDKHHKFIRQNNNLNISISENNTNNAIEDVQNNNATAPSTKETSFNNKLINTCHTDKTGLNIINEFKSDISSSDKIGISDFKRQFSSYGKKIKNKPYIEGKKYSLVKNMEKSPRPYNKIYSAIKKIKKEVIPLELKLIENNKKNFMNLYVNVINHENPLSKFHCNTAKNSNREIINNIGIEKNTCNFGKMIETNNKKRLLNNYTNINSLKKKNTSLTANKENITKKNFFNLKMKKDNNNNNNKIVYDTGKFSIPLLLTVEK